MCRCWFVFSNGRQMSGDNNREAKRSSVTRNGCLEIRNFFFRGTAQIIEFHFSFQTSSIENPRRNILINFDLAFRLWRKINRLTFALSVFMIRLFFKFAWKRLNVKFVTGLTIFAKRTKIRELVTADNTSVNLHFSPFFKLSQL